MITTQNSRIISHHGPAQVWFNSATNQHSLHASHVFHAGDVIINFSAGSIERSASYLTIQVGIDQHITLKPNFLQFVNHSCEPNVFFDTARMQFLCLRNIEAGEQLCFFYPSTEWEMAQPFQCVCQSKYCLKFIQGAALLSVETLLKYRLTDFILCRLTQKRLL